MKSTNTESDKTELADSDGFATIKSMGIPFFIALLASYFTCSQFVITTARQDADSKD